MKLFATRNNTDVASEEFILADIDTGEVHATCGIEILEQLSPIVVNVEWHIYFGEDPSTQKFRSRHTALQYVAHNLSGITMFPITVRPMLVSGSSFPDLPDIPRDIDALVRITAIVSGRDLDHIVEWTEANIQSIEEA